MTWQEELRTLDEDFSAGKLTADEYRLRRDQVLSSAVSTSPPPSTAADTSSTGDDSTQIIAPVSPPQGVPQNASSGHAASDPDGEADADRTQAVQPWQGQYGQQASPPAGFPQPNTASPAAGFPQPNTASPAAGFPQPGQPAEHPPWHAPAEDVSPPWGGSEFPPVAPSSESDWIRQGPEKSGSSAAGRTVGLVIVGVLVVGLVIASIFYFSGGDEPTTPAQPASPPTTTVALPEPPAAKAAPKSAAASLVKPPGKERGGGGALTLNTLRTNQLLPAPVIDALADARMKDGRLVTTSQGDSIIGMYALTTASEDDAADVAAAYGDVQQNGGLPVNASLSLKGVPVFSTPPDAQDAVFRGVYVLYERVVIVETFGPDRDAAAKLFEEVLGKQIEHAPPSKRS